MPFSPPNTFTDGTIADADQVNENFSSVADEINSIADSLASIEQTLDGIGMAEGLVKEDGSVPFTNPVTGVDPTEDYHLATKRYVDSVVGGVSVSAEWDTYSAEVDNPNEETIDNLSITARYVQVGEKVTVQGTIVGHSDLDASTTDLRISLPVTAAETFSGFRVVGSFVWFDSSELGTGDAIGFCSLSSDGEWVDFRVVDSGLFNSVLLPGDEQQVSFEFTYEAASEE